MATRDWPSLLISGTNFLFLAAVDLATVGVWGPPGVRVAGEREGGEERPGGGGGRV